MSASRRARLDRLRRIAQKRVLAAEVEVQKARAALAAAEEAAGSAEGRAAAALACWTDIVCAEELLVADARRVTLRKEAARARARVQAFADELARREQALVGERIGERRLEKVLERLAQVEAARVTKIERRVGDEHASRLAQLQAAATGAEESHR